MGKWVRNWELMGMTLDLLLEKWRVEKLIELECCWAQLSARKLLGQLLVLYTIQNYAKEIKIIC